MEKTQQVVMSDERTAVVEYISERFAEEDFVLNNILARQEEGGGPMMNIGPDQGKFLNLLIKLQKPKKILEVGSYYGYSSVWMGRAVHDLNQFLGATLNKMGESSSEQSVDIVSSVNKFNRDDLSRHKLTCIEISAVQAAIVREHIVEAALEHDVEVFQGAGLELMQKFIEAGESFDMVFIDADKAGYCDYLDLATQLLPSGGLLLVDNTIWSEKVLDSASEDKATQAIQAFNDKLAASEHFDSVIITIQDGLAFAVKR